MNRQKHWGKSERIAEQMRKRIVCGQWAAGSRLPLRTELEQEFSTTPATIQKAVDVLQRDDLVVARGCNGTFVADRLPHRHRIGIVFPCDPSQPDRWHRMYAAIDEAARRLVHEGRYDLRLYHGTEEADSAGRQQLLDDIAADRLAGVFTVAMSLSCFDNTPLLAHPRLRVAALATVLRPGVLAVRIQSLIPAALATLREQGRSRVALIYSRTAPHLPNELLDLVAEHGMTSHPNWCVPAWPSTPEAARTGAYLLLRQPVAERPDAIIVADDYLAEQATQGVLDAGHHAQDELDVLVQCNFPHLPPAVTPILRLGIDLPDLLARTIDALLAPDLPESVNAPLVSESTWRERQLTYTHAPTGETIG